MAYLDRQHSHKRLAGVTGVALIHIALAFGLTAGLTIKYIQPGPPDTFEGTQIELDPPPPPEDTPTPEPRTDTPQPRDAFVAPIPPMDFSRPDRIEVTSELPPLRPVVEVPGNLVIPRAEPPPPAFTPRDPIPRNGPRGWITNEDYPRRAITRELEGSANYALSVGTNGRVNNCRIIVSTGHEVLDDATCRLIERKARFDPATDGSGAEVAGTYRGTITWQIPED